MEIKTITCHNVYNYGATLQAYALQTYLESLGHNVEIIDYAPKYHSSSCWNIPENSSVYKLASRNLLVHIFYAFHRWIKHKRDTNIRRQKKFDEFDVKYLHITKHHYTSYEELKSNPPVANMYIAGSDQIWNPVGGTGLDPAFYLNFGDDDIKRISYAASFGISKLNDNDKTSIKRYLAKIDNISVREKTGLTILNGLGIKSAIQVVDPVFLLDKSMWLKLIKPIDVYKIDKYILVYDFFQDDPSIKSMASKIKKEKNFAIISVNNSGKLPYADKNISDASPVEFLSLINGAEIIISNSFHATAFSIILNKDFLVYPVLRHKNQSRMIDLLEQFTLSNRYNASNMPEDIDWQTVNGYCESYMEEGRYFLKKSISNDK